MKGLYENKKPINSVFRCSAPSLDEPFRILLLPLSPPPNCQDLLAYFIDNYLQLVYYQGFLAYATSISRINSLYSYYKYSACISVQISLQVTDVSELITLSSSPSSHVLRAVFSFICLQFDFFFFFCSLIIVLSFTISSVVLLSDIFYQSLHISKQLSLKLTIK